MDWFRLGRFHFSITGLIFFSMGLLFLILAGALGTIGAHWARESLAHAESLRPISVTALEDGIPGREVMIEGRISTRNQTPLRSFVAYIAEVYEGDDDDGDPIWRLKERLTPPLLIELPDGLVQIEEGYQLEGALTTWREGDDQTWKWYKGRGEVRYRGLEAGSPVIAIGMLVEGREGMALDAYLIRPGNRDEYIAEKRSSTEVLPLLGTIFGSVGLLFALFGTYQFFAPITTSRLKMI